MNILVKRYKSEKDFTIGKVYIDDQFECYSLEDEKRDVKVMHETRIPEGKYKIDLRTFGGHHEQYAKKFPAMHKGMLWVKDVPGFQDILIHIGNTDEDTSGCLLIGLNVDEAKGILYNSTAAYLRFYPKVLAAIEAKKDVWIKYEEDLKK
jgi:hypothetical protein